MLHQKKTQKVRLVMVFYIAAEYSTIPRLS